MKKESCCGEFSVSELKDIIYEKKDHIATITINRPEQRNPISFNVIKEIGMALQDSESDDAIGVVVLTSAGDKAFCGGGDLKSFREEINNPYKCWKTLLPAFNRMIYTARTMGKPLIGRINGVTIGGGVELLLMCDMAIAADHAWFIAGETSVGALPLGATQLLTLSIGDKRARMALFTDKRFDAKTALEWGLINEVVPYERLDEEINSLCKLILAKSPWAIRLAKTQINIWWDLASHTFHSGRDIWALETMLPDFMEGISAFSKKETPDYMKLRKRTAAGETAEYLWGPPTKTCPQCKTENLPDYFEFCGKCGKEL